MTQLLFLELNEINLDKVGVYVDQGDLPTLGALIQKHGLIETTSEKKYEDLEPWIQWITAHTGLALADHGVFRLGDIVKHDYLQIWEVLESAGLKVGAVSPMNANNKCRNAAFFVPDPWTATTPTAGILLAKLYRSVAQAVNDNAQSKITAQSATWLLAGLLRYARPENRQTYIHLAASSKTAPWRKAMLLDCLLADVYITECKKTQPDFASLFLNAGAHIQHHYMFNSKTYSGDLRNPSWYIGTDKDPVLEVYKSYDRIIGQIIAAFPRARLMIATGLHQDPHDTQTFYWRLKDHAAFLDKIVARYIAVEPRMSRDFLIECDSGEDALYTAQLLQSARSEDGTALFEVHLRETSVFVMLTYSNDIDDYFVYTINGREISGFKDDVAFVAIKNGQHNGVGFFLDTAETKSEAQPAFALKEMPTRICRALGQDWPSLSQRHWRTRVSGGFLPRCAILD